MDSVTPDFRGLRELHVDGLAVFSSVTTEQRARQLGARVEDARQWLDALLGFSPSVILAAVAPADWSQVTDFPVYGFPHFVGDDTIAVGGEPAPVFDQILELTWPGVSSALRDQMHATYGDPPQVQAFADLLVVHELAHLYHHQSGFWFPERWIAELFANVALDGYVSERAPELGDVLRVFPRCASGMDDAVLIERDLGRMAESLESGPTGLHPELRLVPDESPPGRGRHLERRRSQHAPAVVPPFPRRLLDPRGSPGHPGRRRGPDARRSPSTAGRRRTGTDGADLAPPVGCPRRLVVVEHGCWPRLPDWTTSTNSRTRDAATARSATTSASPRSG